MQTIFLSAGISGFMIIVWIAIALISVVSNARQKGQTQLRQQSSKQPDTDGFGRWQGNNHYQGQGVTDSSMPMQVQWDQQKIWQQTEIFTEDNRMSETDYVAEEEFRNQKYTFSEEIPNEQVIEFVPEEFGENNSQVMNDQFYSSLEIQNALQDEQDLAREKAYRRKTENAFKPEANLFNKRKRIFSQGTSLKKAILLSEILASPKSMQ